MSTSSRGVPRQRRFDGRASIPALQGSVSANQRAAESWVELSSQPSSSSLSSIDDEIVTTGLRVGGSQQCISTSRRRRTLPSSARSLPHQQTAFRATSTSSQEEYDESESEDDQVLTSSTERLSRTSSQEAAVAEDDDDDSDDGDNATALGRITDHQQQQQQQQQPAGAFRPHPNVFSHPPTQRSNSATYANDFTRPSFSQRSQTSRIQRGSQVQVPVLAPGFVSPSVREDNDAALRASLTTLLSCAAAARGLPRPKDATEASRGSHAGVGPSNQPLGLRLVPESELMSEQPSQARSRPAAAPASSSRRSPATTGSSSPKSKRASSAGRQPRASSSSSSKKKKTATMVQEEAIVSPTLLTWVVSAGVVVLVSVVGFGAGYVIGREVGRQEGLSLSVNETGSASRDVMRSSTGTLRKFKWGAVGKTIAAVG